MADRVDAVLSTLEGSRAKLVARLRLLTAADFAHPELADQLWRLGVADDWTRLVIDQSLGGRPLAAREPRARPAYLVTPELLLAWLAQTRGSLVARARRLADEDLERSVELDGGERRTYAELLSDAVERDSTQLDTLGDSELASPRGDGPEA